MEYQLELGMKGSVELKVDFKHTAASFGSGGVQVFATPMMVGIMENAALKAVDPFLPEGYSTVGIHLDVKHVAATPVGMTVRSEAELIGIEGKKLKFHITAHDEKGLIGEGIHSRAIINLKKFMASVAEKSK